MKHVAFENPTAMPPIQMNRKKKNAHAKEVIPRAIDGIRRCIARDPNCAARRPRRQPRSLGCGSACGTEAAASFGSRFLERHGGEPAHAGRDQKFTEPVALSSSEPGDFPLPRTVSRLGLDLLALRARCKGDSTAGRDSAQGCRRSGPRYLRELLYAHRNWPFVLRALERSDQCFAGPVALSSTLPTDVPL